MKPPSDIAFWYRFDTGLKEPKMLGLPPRKDPLFVVKPILNYKPPERHIDEAFVEDETEIFDKKFGD